MRAGVSARAVFLHFPNVLDLVRAELEDALQAITRPYRYEPADPFERRLGIFVDRARDMRERIAPVNAMASTLANLNESLRVAGDRIAGQLLIEIDSAFAPELARLNPIDRRDCAIAIAALMSSAISDDVHQLCGDAGRDATAFRTNAVRRLLGQPPE